MRLKYLLLILLNLYCPQALSMAFLPLVPGLIGLIASAGLIIDQRMRDRYQKKRFDSIDIKIGDLTTAQNTLRSLVEQAAQENTEQHTVTRQTMQSSAEQLGTKIVDTSASLKTLIEDAAAKNITMHEATKTHLMQLQQTQERMQQLLRASNKSLAYVLFSLMKLTDDNEQLKKHNLELKLKVEEIHQMVTHLHTFLQHQQMHAISPGFNRVVLNQASGNLLDKTSNDIARNFSQQGKLLINSMK